MKNKKVIILSVVAVILLVISIIATSYAIFTANLSGTKDNKLTTGYVTLNCAETNFTLNNTRPMTDAEGIALNNNVASCTLTSTMNGTMRVGYDFALTNVTPSSNITASDVKIQVSRAVDAGTASYVKGTSTSGVTVASLASSAGVYDDSITSYVLDSNVVTGNHSIVYNVKSWLTSGGTSSSTTTSTSGVCSDTSYTTEAACIAGGGVWGDQQTASSTGGSFAFKLKIGATQVFPTSGS